MSGKGIPSNIIVILLVTIVLPLPINIHRASALSVWPAQSPALVDFTSPYDDRLPSAIQASDGTIWLAYMSNQNNVTFNDIWYNTYAGGLWGTPINLTGTNYNSGPALVQLPNSTIVLFWAQSAVSAGQARLFYEHFNRGVASNRIVQVTLPAVTTLSDSLPSATVGPDGTLWLFWTRTNSTTSPFDEQLYYKTLKGNVWSAETKVTSDSNQNYGSSPVWGRDGVLRLIWSKGSPAAGTILLYSKAFNGTTWTSDTLIDNQSSLIDEHPSLIQDRNGTFWLFWGRDVNPTSVQYQVFSKYSLDNGQTWTSDAQMTTGTPDSFQPTAVQSPADKTILLIYASNPSGSYGLYSLKSNPISPVTDVAVLSVTPSTGFSYPGGFNYISISGNKTYSKFITITVVLKNLGDVAKTIPVSLVATNRTVYTFTNQTATLSASVSVTLTFTWDTTNVVPGRYGLKASTTVPGEPIALRSDNVISKSNQIHIDPLGDLTQKGSVTINDVSVFFFDYGFTFQTPSRWNPWADPDGDGVISIIDVSVVMFNYGIVT